VGIEAALGEVEEHGAQAPPAFLRSTGYSGAKALGHGVGYVYPHDEGGYVAQRYLPEGLDDREFYRPTSEGEEARVREFLERMRALRRGASGDQEA
jgi:putative ATPase